MKYGVNFITDRAREKLSGLQVRFVKEDTMWSVWADTFGPDAVKVYHDQVNHFYVFLIKGVFFMLTQTRNLDHSTYPATVNEFSLLDVCDDQESYVSLFENIPPSVERPI